MGSIDDFPVDRDDDCRSLHTNSTLEHLFPPKLPSLGMMKVDGKSPDVLYVVNYRNHKDRLLDRHQSTQPFKSLPSYKHEQDATGSTGKENDKPVLEIVTTVYPRNGCPSRASSSRRRHRPRHHGPDDETESDDETDSDYETESDDEEETEITKMIIHSEHLVNTLRAVIRYYPYLSLNGKTCHIEAPYRVLYHHMKEIAEYRDTQPLTHTLEYAARTKEHIDVLLTFLAENVSAEVRQEEERHKLDTPTATFEHLWLLLKPGKVVYAKKFDIWTPFVISRVEVGSRGSENPTSYKINCWQLESDGSKVIRLMESFKISPWLGEQAISSLSVIPEAFWVEDFDAQGGRTMREKQIAEGKMYWELLKHPTYMEYDGPLIDVERNDRVLVPTGTMCGRVVCDDAGFYKYAGPPGTRRFMKSHAIPRRHHASGRLDHLPKTPPRCGCLACMKSRPRSNNGGEFSGFEGLDPLVDTPPDNDIFYLVCTSVIRGFILGTRQWGNFKVAHLKSVKSDKEAFKYLVLDDEIKLTVKALIGQFAAGTDGQVAPWGNDFVKNKGEGRIFLLHGMPGVGKTCTAECVAELTNRPLLSLTSGDLSVSSHMVGDNLNYFLELGQRYGALVLLDEADVYLESRRSKDISRNSLVSIFLRALEYYRGVLFLTTNRVEWFDPAFLSRIHVALHYKNLRDEDRERIWAHSFGRLDRDSSGKIRVAATAREYAYGSQEVRSLRLNGREIRNAMQTALALAENEAQEEGSDTATIEKKHICAVVKLRSGFKTFMRSKSKFPDEHCDDVDGEEDSHDDE